MTITYPLAYPTTFGATTCTLGVDHAIAVAESEFTFEGQVQEHQGVAWEISVTLELLNRSQAEAFNAFIASLMGRKGTFLFSPPGCGTPQGVATGTPLVNGANQTGNVLITDGWTAGVTNILKAGDLIQLGSGSTATLHRNLTDVNSDGSGNATLNISPKITSLSTSPADNSAIVISNPSGRFRMKDNLLPVAIKSPMQMTIQFSARQAL